MVTTSPGPLAQLLGMLAFIVLIAVLIVTHRVVRRARYQRVRNAALEWGGDRRWLRTLRHPVPEAGDPWLTGPIPIPPSVPPPARPPAPGGAR